MLTAVNSHIKQKISSTSFKTVNTNLEVAVMHCRGHQRDRSSARPRKQQSWSNCKTGDSTAEAEQVMALVIVPLNSLAFPQYSPQEEENAEKWSYGKKSTGWHEKEEKAQQWKFMTSLLMPPAMGEGCIWAEGFAEGGDEDSKQEMLACDLCAHDNPHHPIPVCCSDRLDAEDISGRLAVRFHPNVLMSRTYLLKFVDIFTGWSWSLPHLIRKNCKVCKSLSKEIILVDFQKSLLSDNRPSL